MLDSFLSCNRAFSIFSLLYFGVISAAANLIRVFRVEGVPERECRGVCFREIDSICGENITRGDVRASDAIATFLELDFKMEGL